MLPRAVGGESMERRPKLKVFSPVFIKMTSDKGSVQHGGGKEDRVVWVIIWPYSTPISRRPPTLLRNSSLRS